VSEAIPAGAGDPDWRLGFKQCSLYPITRVLQRIVLVERFVNSYEVIVAYVGIAF
jgi:hypothetical protein